jgi:hypothetical protein
MVNEEIIGGLISALSRGEPLQKAMMTFYNAGYEKQEIEEAAKVVYAQVGAQVAKTGYIKEAVKTIASKVGLIKKNILTKTSPQEIKQVQKTIQEPIQKSPQNEVQKRAQEPIQKSFQEKKPEKEFVDRNKERYVQKVSDYGGDYQNVNQVTSKIERAIKDLSQIKFPSKIEIVNKTVSTGGQPVVVQRVSDYSNALPPKPVSKVITYLLVFILILLLGILAAVFFFKEDLIKMFNSFGLS